ncbi:MAG: protein translocase subunit SecF [Anaerolineae bacterium]|jgi:preprotein translocase SecF subunit|nr:protein translocase subunit SecF [Anaerolineae bacterium]
MYRIVEHRKWYFLISLLIIVPGLLAMIYSTATTGKPFKVAIDFTGGAIWELNFDQAIQPAELRQIFVDAGLNDTAVTTVGDGKTAQVRLKPVDDDQKLSLTQAIKAKFGQSVTESQFALVGPAIGSEVTQAAVVAVFAASIAITLFLVVAFRKVAHPARYGISAVIAMLHDILVTLGIFAIFSLLFGWEADALLLTALLTVISFSVQDTIVVFDRIRENSGKYRGEAFGLIADRSLLETLHRSLATQLNALFMMGALLLFGGPTIRQFVAVMFFGLISGTYSSIFNAVPILVAWEERDFLGTKKRQPQPQPELAKA